MTHTSACAVHNMPAFPNGPCSCGEWAEEWACKYYDLAAPNADSVMLAALLRAAYERAEATAERRGRAAGMREAAEMCNANATDSDAGGKLLDKNPDNMGKVELAVYRSVFVSVAGASRVMAEKMTARADAIERGE